MAFTADEIEDGTGKPGAVVYSTTGDPLAEAIAYLVRMAGLTALETIFIAGTSVGTAPNVTPLAEVHLTNGTRYIELYAAKRVVGRPTVGGQRLLQPRTGQYVDLHLVLSNELHRLWLEACWMAAEYSAQGKKLFEVVDEGRAIKREKTTAALETEWFEGGGSSTVQTYHEVTKRLDPLLAPIGRLVRA